ncbi:patatin-like phospholipase family protein [Chitinophaga sp. Cy-1792]|uniref:patatin-like phospholipase family protein n=1 Tax=Chitinophaga sp. Cy-1792 TaxID=2608339 RepID=UPI00141F3C41|nr:patatin-like phospholipase family protein [Chitinophaga sp. Cy-1792]NIG53256.1 hypothetical protein [Chitinophaga sp. Cy-1792]
MTKKALVINGGGSRGAFAVGILKQLSCMHPVLQFDMCCGTSSGALIATMAVLGELEILEKIFTGNKTQDIIATGNILDRFVNNNSLYNATPLQLKIGSILTDSRSNKLISSDKSLFIGCNNMQTGRTTYFTNNLQAAGKHYDLHPINDPSTLRNAVMAAYSMPVFMAPMLIGEHQYTDAGAINNTSIQLAIDHGATDIYVILHTPSQMPTTGFEYRNVLDMLEHTADRLAADNTQPHLPILYNQTLDYLHTIKSNMKNAGLKEQDIASFFDTPDNPFAGRQKVNIHMIRPDQPLDGGPGGLDYVPGDMRIMLEAGVKKAATLFP